MPRGYGAAPDVRQQVTRKHRKAIDPVQGYREWVQHRLDPGHWLGGNVPYWRRQIWSPADRRPIGAILIIVSVALAVGTLFVSRQIDTIVAVVVPLSLIFILGLILLARRD